MTRSDEINSENAQEDPTGAQIKDYLKETLDSENNVSKLYDLTDVILADFNGDGAIDKAKFIKNDNSGIMIIYGNSNDTVKIGFEKEFAHMTDLNWVNYWGLVIDSVTFEILFENNEISGDTVVKLENPSIALIKEEAPSGLITFKNGEFVWIHQTD